MPRPIIIDCDPGLDDAIALAMALRSPELDVKDITTSAGNQTPEKTLHNALGLLTLMQREDIGSVPINDGDKLVGMVTDRDITVRAVAEGKGPDTKVRDVMSTEQVLYCFEDQEIDEVAATNRRLAASTLTHVQEAMDALTGPTAGGTTYTATGTACAPASSASSVSPFMMPRSFIPSKMVRAAAKWTSRFGTPGAAFATAAS